MQQVSCSLTISSTHLSHLDLRQQWVLSIPQGLYFITELYFHSFFTVLGLLREIELVLTHLHLIHHHQQLMLLIRYYLQVDWYEITNYYNNI